MLEADIDLSSVDFNGIPSFGGTWEGQNHAITGLSLSQDGSVQGLFRYVQQGALVRDMTVKGRIKPGGTRASVGGIAGSNAGTIENCAFDGVVSGTSQIGGIAGVNAVKGSINGCTVSGTVYGSHFVGGVVGQNDGVAANCTNAASVNTTVSQNEVKLNDLTLDNVLKTEKANDVTDAGGIAGNNAGVLRACINRGTIGYSHIGYNVGGIAGSQTGYVEGCVNYGTVNARKEGGGIVGQMEPSSVLQYNQDTLQELQGELDTLSALMNKATNDASASSSELTSQLNDLTGRVDSAREAVDTLIDKAVNGFDIGTQTINITNLTKLTGQGTINGSGNGINIVSVLNIYNLPAAGGVTGSHILGEGHIDIALNGDIVFIVEHYKLAQLESASKRCRLLLDSLLKTAVAHQNIGVVIHHREPGLIELRSQMAFRNRHTNGIGNALTQRTRGGLYAVRVAVLGVSRSLAAPLTEGLYILHGNLVAAQMQHGIKQHGAVSGGKNESVAVCKGRILGIVLEFSAVYGISKRCSTHGKARMSAVCLLHALSRKNTDGVNGLLFNRFHVVPPVIY